MSTKGVLAVGGVPIILHEVTKADIEDAKNRRDEARAEAEAASDTISQLEDQRSDLEGELAKLNDASEAQREQYVIIYGQLEAALEEKAAALDEYIETQENLEAQQSFSQTGSLSCSSIRTSQHLKCFLNLTASPVSLPIWNLSL